MARSLDSKESGPTALSTRLFSHSFDDIYANYGYMIRQFFWVFPDSDGNFCILIVMTMLAQRQRGAVQGALASGCPWGPPRVCLDQTHSLWCKRTDLWVAALDASAGSCQAGVSWRSRAGGFESALAAAHPSACSALYTMPSRYSKPDALAILFNAHGEQGLQSGRLWVPWWCIAFFVLY